MKKFKKNELEDLNKYLGGNTNIRSHANCVTRFRFQILDKDKVETEKIKKISFVRGTNWAGDELQVVIGPEVTRVREKYMDLFPEGGERSSTEEIETTLGKKKKFSFKKSITGFISNVMIPLIPALMAAGMTQALYAILTTSGAIEAIKAKSLIEAIIKEEANQYNVFSIVLFLISDVGLKFIGLLIGYNTIRYIGGKQISLVMAVLVPLVVAAPTLFPDFTWFWFKIGDVKINVQSYASMILPQIGGGFIYVYLDRWIKKWMPMVIDVVFRHFLAFFATTLLVFFAVGPILGLLESGIYYTFSAVQKIPYGFGVGIFGFCWTFLVLTGMHLALGTAIMNETVNNNNAGSQLLALTSITSITTIATCLAVFLRAKEANMKNIAFGSLFPGAFGISEPTYYSISMIRPILFVPVICARGLVGIFIGVLNIRGYQPGGRGVLGFTTAISQYAAPDNLLKMILAMVFLFVVCFVLTLFLYQERKNDKKQVIHLYSTIFKNLKLKKTKETSLQYKKDLVELTEQINSQKYKKTLKELENLIIKENNLKYILMREENKKVAKPNKFEKKKLKKSNANQKKLKKINHQVEKLMNKIEPVHLKLEEELKKAFQPLFVGKKEVEIQKINNLIFNTVHNLEINYKIIEKLDV